MPQLGFNRGKRYMYSVHVCITQHSQGKNLITLLMCENGVVQIYFGLTFFKPVEFVLLIILDFDNQFEKIKKLR